LDRPVRFEAGWRVAGPRPGGFFTKGGICVRPALDLMKKRRQNRVWQARALWEGQGTEKEGRNKI